MKSRILLSVVVTVLLCFGLGRLWLSTPALQNQDGLKKSISRAQSRFLQLQREASNKTLNGYLSQEFLPLWGAPGVADPEAQVVKDFSDWAAFAAKDHGQLLKTRDEAYSKARARFEKHLPALVATLDKRLFTVPRKTLSAKESPSATGLGLVAQAVYAYTASKVAEGKPETPLPALGALYTLGGNLQGRDTLSLELTGISLQRTAFRATGLLPRDSSISGKQWIALSSAILSTLPPPEGMTRAFELEVAVSLEQLSRSQEALARSSNTLEQMMMERETRIFLNQTSAQLRMVQAEMGESFTPTQSGAIPLIRLNDFLTARDIMSGHRLMLQLTMTALDLRAYRASRGKLPPTLGGLKEMGIEPPLASAEYDPKEQTLGVVLSSTLLAHINKPEFDIDGWSRVKQNKLQLEL